MLNLTIGSAQDVEGRSCILTGRRPGHAVYGPYEALEPGRYVVTFKLGLAAAERGRQDSLLAVLDVAAEVGQTILATKQLFPSSFADGRTTFSIEFSLSRPARVEYRVWVSGNAALIIEEYRRALPVTADADDLAAVVASGLFPVADGTAPAFFRENVGLFRGLYEQGMGVSLLESGAVLTVAGVSLHAQSTDDLHFVGEIFQQQAYNLKTGRRLAVIDVGMNIGLTSLMLATKAEVAEIHAFEPFANTYDRAMDNLRLNPALAPKITARNVGLSDQAWDGPIKVNANPNSGSQSTIALATGIPVHLVLEEAGQTLGPIIARAEERGLAVAIKLDCEGSEFAIMRSLAAAGLIGRVAAFMVEWHAIFAEHTQETLLAPLREHGFLIFDQSPPTGNGFFYAVRMG